MPPRSAEYLAQLSERMKGTNVFALMTPEAVARLNASRLGHPTSEETKQKISATLMGHSHSDETVAKIRATIKAQFANGRKATATKHFLGKKHTPETIRKCAEARRLYWQRRRGEIAP